MRLCKSHACDDGYTHSQKPLLFLDVDGVISLFGFREGYGLAPGNAPFADCPPGRLHSINGVMHYISASCGGYLRRLAEHFELVWATGWEEAANDYLPHLLELPGQLPFLTFDGRVAAGAAHWKIEAIAAHAGDAGRSPGSTTTSTRAVMTGPRSAPPRR